MFRLSQILAHCVPTHRPHAFIFLCGQLKKDKTTFFKSYKCIPFLLCLSNTSRIKSSVRETMVSDAQGDSNTRRQDYTKCSCSVTIKVVPDRFSGRQGEKAVDVHSLQKKKKKRCLQILRSGTVHFKGGGINNRKYQHWEDFEWDSTWQLCTHGQHTHTHECTQT